MRLLTRTTRSVAPTEAGERVMETLRPALDEIETRLDALSALRDKPAGLVRISVSEHAAEDILWPVLARLLPDYPDIKVELFVDQGFTNIVTERFDAGVRLGESVEKDMIAVRIGPELRMAVVGSPGYLAQRGTPATPHDLAHHDCVNSRLTSAGGLCVGVREGGARAECARERTAHFQQSALGAARGKDAAFEPRKRSGRSGDGHDGGRSPRARVRGLVPAVCGLSSRIPGAAASNRRRIKPSSRTRMREPRSGPHALEQRFEHRGRVSRPVFVLRREQ